MEKTAIGVAVQVPKQVCQPVIFWMFWITCAVLGMVIAASGFTAMPNAISKAKVTATKCGRTTSFSLFILTEPFSETADSDFLFFKTVAGANVFEVYREAE